MKGTKLLVVSLLFLLPFALMAQEGEDRGENAEKTKMNAGTFRGLELRNIGPAFMSGRIQDIAINPENENIWYVAVGSGSVWKTVNSGTTWTPIFENYGSYSIGCVTIDPTNPNVIWVGTGENVSGRHVAYGDGVYKSMDAGKSFKNMGLKETEHIARIIVDPRDSNVIYVASEGPLWSDGGERGVYKSTDGGVTWNPSLETSDKTGVTSLVIDPRDPDVLYAASFQRRRSVAALIDGGPETAIYKTEDGGENWRKLSGGLPRGDMGKIGLDISPIDPDVIYATIELSGREGGFWRSEDRGESWSKMSDYISGGTGPHYYQEIFADPHKFDRIYQMNVRMSVTEDGGKTWTTVNTRWKHVDNHAMGFKMSDPNYLVVGCDGGIYDSYDRGDSWRYASNLPITQFYKVALDNALPFYNVYGGAQDNSTQGGPSRTLNVHGIRTSDWFILTGGDGYQPAVDWENDNIVYSQSQKGNLFRYDKKTLTGVRIVPEAAPGDPAERWNWDPPILVSPHDSARLYYASQRVWRSDDRGDSWTAISGDLSRGLNRFKMKMMGKTWGPEALWDNFAMSWYNTITAIAESPNVDGLIYAGTDDGLIQVTEDGGQNWSKIEGIEGVHELAFVNDIKADLFDADTVYAAFDAHKYGDFQPYLFKSTDRGKTWTSIVSNLPDRHVVWRLVQDHVNKDLLFCATEFGIYFTVNGGENWIKLSGGVPVIAFRDLAIQKRENDLVGASFGRGLFILDDYSPLRTASEELLNKEIELFPIKNTLQYIPKRPMGGGEKASQGDTFYNAPNPPFGAIFTYYLKDSIMTDKQNRQREDAKESKAGKDVDFPDWHALKQENREERPTLIFTIKDSAGNEVRKLTAPAMAGFHRIAWDLSYPSTMPPAAPGSGRGFRGGGSGPMVLPGIYTVSIGKREKGVVSDFGVEQSFEVVSYGETTLPDQDRAATLDFQHKTAEFIRAAMGTQRVVQDAFSRIGMIKMALDSTPGIDAAFMDEARALENRLQDLNDELTGDSTAGTWGDATPPSIQNRIFSLMFGHWSSTYGPTKTHRQSFDIAVQQYEELVPKLRTLIEVDIVTLEEKMEAAGVPWTPGRKIPTLKK